MMPTEILIIANRKRALRTWGEDVGLYNSDGILARGVHADVIKRMQIKPATFDGDTMAQPPVFDDDNVYANILLTAEAEILDRVVGEEGFNASKLRRWFRKNGFERQRASKHPDYPGSRAAWAKTYANGDEVEVVWPLPGRRARKWA